MTQPNVRYGWIPDLPDARDQYFKLPRAMAPLPRLTDLRAGCPDVYDQGQLGSCTANAIGAALEFGQKKQKMPKPFMPSRLFIYYNERSMEGTIQSDSGAMLRDGIKTVASDGACPEKLWPYIEEKFAIPPTVPCYKAAKAHPALQYSRLIPNLDQLKGCLAAGFPFVFGFTAYSSLESPQTMTTGALPMPTGNERPVGGHAVMAVGYDDKTSRFLIRNSWGPGWGIGGYFTMPYEYVASNLSDDFWTIRLVR